MSGWQVGDLALKLNDTRMPAGTIARVVAVINQLRPSSLGKPPAFGLVLEGWETPSGAWYSPNFRKIKPDTEPCEEEFTVLIKRGRKVQA